MKYINENFHGILFHYSVKIIDEIHRQKLEVCKCFKFYTYVTKRKVKMTLLTLNLAKFYKIFGKFYYRWQYNNSLWSASQTCLDKVYLGNRSKFFIIVRTGTSHLQLVSSVNVPCHCCDANLQHFKLKYRIPHGSNVLYSLLSLSL
jgi:hypothetical protein